MQSPVERDRAGAPGAIGGGLTVTPKFIFGVNGQLNNSLRCMQEEKRLIYVAGHNIIIYNVEDKTQQFISGSENATEINYVTLSTSGNYLAYCERAEPRA